MLILGNYEGGSELGGDLSVYSSLQELYVYR